MQYTPTPILVKHEKIDQPLWLASIIVLFKTEKVRIGVGVYLSIQWFATCGAVRNPTVIQATIQRQERQLIHLQRLLKQHHQ